jgi:hypothetical protein
MIGGVLEAIEETQHEEARRRQRVLRLPPIREAHGRADGRRRVPHAPRMRARSTPVRRATEQRLRMCAVPRLAPINRVISRHRRATALIGVLVVLGVGALDAHAALPEHHHQDGKVTVCIAALAIADLAALGWCKQSTPNLTTRPRSARRRQAASRPAIDIPKASARAGPSGLAVLRL